jgi:hypothetical protein
LLEILDRLFVVALMRLWAVLQVSSTVGRLLQNRERVVFAMVRSANGGAGWDKGLTTGFISFNGHRLLTSWNVGREGATGGLFFLYFQPRLRN